MPARLLSRKMTAFAIAVTLTVSLLALAARVQAQVGATQFKMPEYYPSPNQDRLKTLTTGDSARAQPDGSFLIQGLKIATFRTNSEANLPELTITAPSCVLHKDDQRSANSAGPLYITSGDGKLTIDGEGFLWQQKGSNATLTISNKVHTTIKREFLAQSARTNAAPLPAPASASASTGSNQIIHIYSDRAFFDREAGRIHYDGHVHAEDSQTELYCDTMSIRRSTNGATTGGGSIDAINADDHVIIVSKTTGGRATGDHAVYTANEGKRQVELTGNPRWENGPSVGTGKMFVFDLLQNTLRAEGDAYLKLPRNSVGRSGLLLSPQSTAPAPAATTTNAAKPVEIYADTMIFQLPPTNGPVQAVTAERNVIIMDTEKNSRASGGRAVYTESSGKLVLSENALWQVDRQVAKGSTLIFDRNQQSFSARTNAFLRFPLHALGQTLNAGAAAVPARTNAANTNAFVQVLAKQYDYQDDTLIFRDDVHAALVDGEEIRGVLDAAMLKVNLKSNLLESVEAMTNVYARLLPVKDARGKTNEKELQCDYAKVTMRTTNLVESINASGKVIATQTLTRTNNPLPRRVTLNSDSLTATFLPTTNEVEKIVADRNVIIRRDDTTAWGARAVYTTTNELAVLTGSPQVEGPMGQVTADGLIQVDSLTGRITGRSNVVIRPSAKAAGNLRTNVNASASTLKTTSKSKSP